MTDADYRDLVHSLNRSALPPLLAVLIADRHGTGWPYTGPDYWATETYLQAAVTAGLDPDELYDIVATWPTRPDPTALATLAALRKDLS